MSTNVSSDVLKLFVYNKIGDSLDKREAQDLKIKDEFVEVAEELDTNEIVLEGVLENDGLYALFATMYQEEKEQNNEENKEAKKEEQNRVSGASNGAGV